MIQLDDWARHLSDADKCHLILDDGSDHKVPHFPGSISDYARRLSGLDIRGCWRLCRKTGGARLRIAGIAKSDANNLNVSDEPDTSGPWHAVIATASPKRSLMSSLIVFRSVYFCQRIKALALIEHIRQSATVLSEISNRPRYRAGISRPAR